MFTDNWKVLVLNFSVTENTVIFWVKKLMEKIIFTDYCKILVLNFSVVGNTTFFWLKKLMERYLLVIKKFLFWTFRWWEIWSFFSQKVGRKMIFTWSFWAFHDVPRLRKYGFSCSDSTYFLVIKKIHEGSISGEKLSSTCIEKLFGITTDSKLTSEEHLEELCKNPSQKINALARISSLMRFEQRKRIVNSFVTSQFSYCPLVWMFYTWLLNNCINHIHERTLRIIYQDYNFSFKELLKKRQLVSNSPKKLKTIGNRNWMCPDIIEKIFEIDHRNYNFCRDVLFKWCNIWLAHYNTERASIGTKNMWHFT